MFNHLRSTSAIDDSIPAPSLKPSPIDSTSDSTEISSSTSSSFYTSLKPKEIDYHCLRKILSTLSDNLYGIYYEFKSAKELWEVFEEKYGLDDAGINRFTFSFFSKFIMVDNKPINDQLHEFQDCIRHVRSKGN